MKEKGMFKSQDKTSRFLLAWAPGRAVGEVMALQKFWVHCSVHQLWYTDAKAH